jgi:hypothetical protein
MDVVEFLISKGANSWRDGMYGASLAGHRNIIDFLWDKSVGTYDVDLCLRQAASGGHFDLVKLFVEHGATDWSQSIRYAEKGSIGRSGSIDAKARVIIDYLTMHFNISSQI